MTLQQIRILHAALRYQFNLTLVADALATSQSGISRHIKELEDELGIALFQRHGKRLLGLTAPGEAIAGHATRIMLEIGNIKSAADNFAKADSGTLTIATTHTQARYVLPSVIAKFQQAYPAVRLVLHQTRPQEIVAMLLQGRADIGIATEALASHDDIIAFPYHSWSHCVIVPRGHKLADAPLPGDTTSQLKTLATYPIITYHDGLTGRGKIDAAFAKAGVTPNIVMEALDADVIKAYVGLGMGVGIIAALAFDEALDSGLVALPNAQLSGAPLSGAQLSGASLFDASTSLLAIRHQRRLRGFAYAFLALCRPELTEAVVRKSLVEE